jgi:adenylate cyclase
VIILRRFLVAKLALVLLAALGLGYALPAWINARAELRMLEATQRQSATALATTIGASLRTSMLAGDAMNARAMVHAARASVQGLDLSVYAVTGEEVFGEPRPQPGSAPAHVMATLQTMRPQQGPSSAFAEPILNRSRCRYCHAEGDLRGVLTLGIQGARKPLTAETVRHAITSLTARAFLQMMTADEVARIEGLFDDLVTRVPSIQGIGLFAPDGSLSLGQAALPAAAITAALAQGQVAAHEPWLIMPLANEARCHGCHGAKARFNGALAVAVAEDSAAATFRAAVGVGLDHMMLSGLGRLTRTYIDDVAATGLVAQITLHDRHGALYRDGFATYEAPPVVSAALRQGLPQTVTLPGSFQHVAPLHNDAACQRCHDAGAALRGAIAIRLDTRAAEAQREQLATMGFAFGAGTSVLVLMLLFLGLRLLVVRPVSEIGEVADRVAAGELNVAVTVRSIDEIGRLGDRINQMVVELRKKLALSRFVSSATVASIDAGHGEISRHGEQVSGVVFFSDIRGFTSYSEGREPEQVVQMLNRLLDAQAKAVRTYGGDIDKFVGDEVMAHFFGDNAAERAVDAGVAAVAAVERANASMPEAERMAIGVGLAAGPMILGAMGAENRLDFTVIGDTVNTGARLCSAAAGGQVLVNLGIAAMVDPGRLRALPPLVLKGKRDPVPVWAVCDPGPART